MNAQTDNKLWQKPHLALMIGTIVVAALVSPAAASKGTVKWFARSKGTLSNTTTRVDGAEQADSAGGLLSGLVDLVTSLFGFITPDDGGDDLFSSPAADDGSAGASGGGNISESSIARTAANRRSTVKAADL